MTLCVVTGATGFIGSQLVKQLLNQGHSVRCLVRSSSNLERIKTLGAEIYTLDFSDKTALKKSVESAQYVYHCAGCILTNHAEEMYQTNCRNTALLAQSCAEQTTPPTFVFISSLAAAGVMRQQDAPCPADSALSSNWRPEIFSADDLPRQTYLRQEWMPELPVSVYGKSKLAAEKELRKICDKLPISIVRPPIILGPGDKCGLPMFQAIQNSGFHFCPGWERKRYTVVFAQDVVKTLIAAAEKGTRLTTCDAPGYPDNSYQSGLYFVSRGEHPEYGALGEIIGKLLGRKRTIAWHVARPIFWTVCTCSEFIGRIKGTPLYLNWDKAREAIAGSWVCSGEKAKRELGIEFSHSFEQLLTETIEDYRRRGWL